MTQQNPYAAPQEASSLPKPVVQPDSTDLVAVIAWPFVFLLNMIVPLMFGLDLTARTGRTGMWIASLLLLVLGWIYCGRKSFLGRRLVLGSIFTALSQAFPILHLILGMIAFGIMRSLGGAHPGDDIQREEITGEFSAFVMTLMVAVPLLVLAQCIGLAIAALYRLVFPKKVSATP